MVVQGEKKEEDSEQEKEKQAPVPASEQTWPAWLSEQLFGPEEPPRGPEGEGTQSHIGLCCCLFVCFQVWHNIFIPFGCCCFFGGFLAVNIFVLLLIVFDR